MTEISGKEAIYTVLAQIPPGCVTSYGKVAELAGLPRAARMVGTVLSQLPADSELPWYRVIRADGRIAFPTDSERFFTQKNYLETERVEVVNGKVSLRRFGWQP